MRALLGIMLMCGLAGGSIAAAQGRAKPSKLIGAYQNAPLGISGLASSARFCVASASGNTHPIGWVREGARVTVSFQSDFDPVAAMTLVQLGAEAPNGESRASFVSDDDSGGNLEPGFQWVTSHSGLVTLFVRAYAANTGGCYHYKVEIQD